MANQLRVVRATGADGPVLLTGIFSGISRRPGDQYNKAKQPIYVPESSTVPTVGAAGLSTADIAGYIDLDVTMDVWRMLNHLDGAGVHDGSIRLLTDGAEVSNSGVYDDAVATIQGTLATADLLAGPDRLSVGGTTFLSLAPVQTALHVREPARHSGTTAGATKDTSAAGANVLRLSVNGGPEFNVVVTAVAGLTNAVLLRELMQGFAAAGYSTSDLFVDAGDVASTGTFTLAGQPDNNDQADINGKTYTFQTVLTDVDGNVLIGATASDTIDNLIAAITLGAGAGTLYAASMTANTDVAAVAGPGDTMDVTALVAGSAGDAITTTTPTNVSGNLSWGGATLSGGLDDETIRISSPLGATLEIVTSGLATVLGMTPATYTPTVRGTVGEADFDTFTGINITVLASNPEYPTGTVVDDYVFVMANNQLAVDASIVYDAVPFTVPFYLVA